MFGSSDLRELHLDICADFILQCILHVLPRMISNNTGFQILASFKVSEYSLASGTMNIEIDIDKQATIMSDQGSAYSRPGNRQEGETVG